MAPYSYQLIDESNHEIRLMTLLPAQDRESEVVCDLNNVRLTEDNVPAFEALSYTWGPPANPSTLRVSSLTNESIEVTRNLSEALPYLRDPEKPRILWIDAVCINQKSLAERGQQVQRMASIYSLAERVIVWLGLDDTDTNLAMAACGLLDSKVDTNVGGYAVLKCRTNDPADAHWGDKHAPLPYDGATWQAIAKLLRRPWFSRLWIWQEIRLAKPNAVITCGTDTMPWMHLRKALDCMVYKRVPFDTIGVEGLGALVRNGFDLATTYGYITLKRLLTLMRHAQCTDSRDRVYGILGLSSNTDAHINVRPDYTKSVADVYMELLVCYMEKSQRLELFSLCELDETLHNWPSWVPYLEKPKTTRHLTHSHSSGHSPCSAERLDYGVLKLTGIITGKVSKVDRLITSPRTEPDLSYAVLVEAIQRWVTWFDMASAYIDGNPMAEALCRTICAGAISDAYVPPHTAFPSMESSRIVLRDIMESSYAQSSNSPDKKLFLEYGFKGCNGRAFFTTAAGHVGMGPAGTRVDDKLCVFLGCDFPMVIRPAENGRFRIVGESYVPGIASNEALLGRLQSNYRAVVGYDVGSGLYNWGFFDSQTGKVQVEDPRLCLDLPQGWRLANHDLKRVWERFVHDGAPAKLENLDPRLSKLALLSRGVPLENVEII
ncbi:hypothetical protein N0V83_007737 [Neocucurbitaria cava]|uniref:Heterokaryon incompatibility domain-containing protein n=1 Tax=Neocucurbitaria cava TaxID=798079 RepID=A0A9W8Y2V8_9PLEO|nr:hypothetical protein N0V83_007737 [Neocucurbitaria cava]